MSTNNIDIFSIIDEYLSNFKPNELITSDTINHVGNINSLVIDRLGLTSLIQDYLNKSIEIHNLRPLTSFTFSTFDRLSFSEDTTTTAEHMVLSLITSKTDELEGSKEWRKHGISYRVEQKQLPTDFNVYLFDSTSGETVHVFVIILNMYNNNLGDEYLIYAIM